MALVDGLLAALPRRADDHDPRVVARAAEPGRIKGTALELWEKALAYPRGADGIIRRGLRAARHLHSRERRFVADALPGLFRHRLWIQRVLGTDDTEELWLGWLALQGLELGPPYDALLSPDASAFAGLSDVEAVRLAGSLTPALAKALLESLGTAVGPFLAASNERGAVTLRAAGISREDLQERLGRDGVGTFLTPLARHGLTVEGRHNLIGHPAYQQGLFEVQDEGSQLVSELVAAEGTVVDFCAGAGGKSLAMSDRADRIVAADIRPHALEQLAKRAERGGVEIESVVLPEKGPLPQVLHALVGKADRVIVDAPCSGTGVLRGHPGYRLRLDLHTLAELPPLQRAILDRAAPLVRPGGRLVYATCSVLRQENQDVAAAFLGDHRDFRLVPAREILGNPHGDFLSMAPHTQHTDGFFGAVFERR